MYHGQLLNVYFIYRVHEAINTHAQHTLNMPLAVYYCTMLSKVYQLQCHVCTLLIFRMWGQPY